MAGCYNAVINLFKFNKFFQGYLLVYFLVGFA